MITIWQGKLNVCVFILKWLRSERALSVAIAELVVDTYLHFAIFACIIYLSNVYLSFPAEYMSICVCQPLLGDSRDEKNNVWLFQLQVKCLCVLMFLSFPLTMAEVPGPCRHSITREHLLTVRHLVGVETTLETQQPWRSRFTAMTITLHSPDSNLLVVVSADG